MGKNIHDIDMPTITIDYIPQYGGFCELQEEYSIVVELEHLYARQSLNSSQKAAYDTIMMHVDNSVPSVFFIDGLGGTGKTFLYKALLAEVRSRGHIALATASSPHITFPGEELLTHALRYHSVYNITQQSGTMQLLRESKLIIWNEAMMAKRQAIEALDQTMQDIKGKQLPFGGKIMVLGGDFRQVLPVVRNGTRAQIVDSRLRMSPLYPTITKMQLITNIRVRIDPWFSNFLLQVRNRDEYVVDENYVHMSDEMTLPYMDNATSKDALIDAIFPLIRMNGTFSDYIISRAILSTKNDTVNDLNDQLIAKFEGVEKIYYSFDEAMDDTNNYYPVEFLNSLTVSGMLPYCLRLKLGCPIILLRNIDPSNGLCNGTRLLCRGFQHNVINTEISVGKHARKRVYLPRILYVPLRRICSLSN